MSERELIHEFPLDWLHYAILGAVVQALDLRMDCRRCGAVAGERCHTRSGRRATYQHGCRWEDARAIGEEQWEKIEADVRSWPQQ